MNIKITYDWLLEYLETDADPYEMQKYLSLSGPSIETVEKVGDDYVFDIEITSNRIDMASVFGVAQEAQAILPQFGKKAKLKFNPLEKYTFENLHAEPVPTHKLDVTIEDAELCSRFTAMVISDVQIKPSSEIIKKRLELSDIRSLNNVIDISNYLMLSLGQPTHMFDFDQIKGQKMILRRSKKGEKMTTLDGKEFTLPGDDIIIEDGSGRIIDLCGIMGGENSSITEDTRNVLFFVQTYNKRHIRKTSMTTGQRTMAATYFEKGLDPERVETAFVYGIDLLLEATGGHAASELVDLYPHKREEKKVKVYLKDIHRVIGVTIDEKKVTAILEDLGFSVKRHENEELAYPDGVYFEVTVPTYRTDDVDIKEDIIEEVARVYGYYNLPNTISPLIYIKQLHDMEMLFKTISKSKHYLKHIGLHEFINYSMVSEELLKNLGMDPSKHLKLSNTISKEIEYMRRSLAVSLVKNIKDNQGKKDILKIFEIAKIYIPRDNDLPEEQYILGIAVTTDFFDLKGIVEGLMRELNIYNYTYEPKETDLFSQNTSTTLMSGDKQVGRLGMLKKEYADNMALSEDVYIAEIDFGFIQNNYSITKPYKDPVTTAIIKLDVTIDMKERVYGELEKKAYDTSHLLQNIEIIDRYKDNLTIRFYFADSSKNITEEDAKKELEKIQKTI
ncbi:phenylalanine--tRNA ligase subunit beta [Candidatus Roizmanbacteria bacterium]|nr:MAG: phenylalanine--tRNA ligase subunit beta [Candidatus Roizmanbacteria bacterium]